VATDPPARAPLGLAPAAQGGVYLADRRNGVVLLDRAGQVRGRWELLDLQALAAGADGTAVAAAGEQLYRLRADHPPAPLGGLGTFRQVAALAVEGSGKIWVLERRGERVGALDPGASEVMPVWQAREAELDALAWDGSRLVALDTKSRAVVTLEAGGATRPVVSGPLERSAGLAADLSGRVAVLDAKTDRVLVFGRDGRVQQTLAVRELGVERPAALTLGLDGVVQLLDAAAGNWVRLP
ncbi:MAG TPA: hypothetical protein VJS92_16840, partial [Candidatus Polarisedimenticolaceae bacterium]|nr:hypothetical protein [Candidatus Polarisedimenticolaceae bacterium]